MSRSLKILVCAALVLLACPHVAHPLSAKGELAQYAGTQVPGDPGVKIAGSPMRISANVAELSMVSRMRSLQSVLANAAKSGEREPPLPPESYDFESIANKHSTQTLAPVSSLPVQSHWWSTLKLVAVFGTAVVGLTFAEWKWMIRRQARLRTLVQERTQELEAEKAELLRTKAALVVLASHDSLTGLYNRGAIFEVLEQEAKRAERERSTFAVVLADLDKFKLINDTYGHLAGDDVLREFARRVLGSLRAYDQVGRFGGEELLILMPGLRDESGARILKLHEAIGSEPFVLKDTVLEVTCSFGVAWFSETANTVESLLSAADEALYAAKANGRNRVECALSHSAVDREDREDKRDKKAVGQVISLGVLAGLQFQPPGK